MCRRTRSSLIDPDEVTIVHATAKTSRNLFLIGQERSLKADYSHRKDWIYSIMEFQSSLMAIDVLGFALMSNHVHFILRSRPDIVKRWTDQEAARRWLTLCPKSKKKVIVDGKTTYEPVAPTKSQIQTLAANTDRIGKLRKRLSSISWWMRLLCQKVAQRANIEDGGSMGHFWKGRFHAVVIYDESHLLSCSVYVDLNAVKALIALNLESYPYTSANLRMENIQWILKQNESATQSEVQLESQPEVQAEQQAEPQVDRCKQIADDRGLGKKVLDERTKRRLRRDFLSPIKLVHQSQDPEVHEGDLRCSDKGFLDLSEREYLDLLEWCVKHELMKSESEVPGEVPGCLKRVGLEVEDFLQQAREFDTMYRYEAGVKPVKELIKSDRGSQEPPLGPTP